MMNYVRYILLIYLFFITSSSIAQTLLHVTDSIALPSPVAAVSSDRRNHIFIASVEGSIRKYTPEGDLLLTFSPPKAGEASLLEAWKTMQVFVFYETFQEFLILDRFLNTSNRYTFPMELVGYAQMATFASDQGLWVFDGSDFSLKKYHPQTQQVTIVTSLNLLLDPSNYKVTFMREYQNLVFVGDENSGILIFDNLGNYLKKLAYPQVKFFTFLDEEIVFLKENKVHFIHLYNQKENERIWEVPSSLSLQQCIPTRQNLIGVSEQNLYFLQKK